MKDKLYYIVGISLLVLLILVVYVGSRVQNVELGLADVDARLAVVESALGITRSTSYDGSDYYGASALESFDNYGYPSYDEQGYGEPYYDYTTE